MSPTRPHLPGPTLNYCRRNVDARTRSRLRTGEFDAMEDVCLQRCGDCYAGPFLIADGALLSGGSHEELLRRLSQPDEPSDQTGISHKDQP